MPRMLPDEARRLLSNVPQQLTFRCRNGDVYWNMCDLARAASNMESHVFSHHVNEERNDFANWIADVIGDRTLARELWQTRNPATVSRRLAERVASLKSRTD